MRPLSVTETNNYVNKLFSSDLILSDIKIEGEISNFIHHYSGHMYFSLKDNNSRIKSVMFKGNNKNLDIIPKEGMKVVARGYISLYEREGEYQFYIRHMEESGIGDLYKQYIELKDRLEKEGLFDLDRKRELPLYPKNIGIISSKTGAAVRDIITVIKRRYPSVNIFLYPSLVQGEEAPKEIVKGLDYLNSMKSIDLIIIARGGGAMEELFAFNDEYLARKIFASKIPIISAVGHEVDYTISDYVSDIRAATPSVAGELAVPDVKSFKDELKNRFREVEIAYINKIDNERSKLNDLDNKIKLLSPRNKILSNRQEIDRVFRYIVEDMNKKIYRDRNELIKLKSKLDLLNPTLGLEKGNGILINKNGKVIKSINEVRDNEDIDILLKDGKIKVNILSIEKGGL